MGLKHIYTYVHVYTDYKNRNTHKSPLNSTQDGEHTLTTPHNSSALLLVPSDFTITKELGLFLCFLSMGVYSTAFQTVCQSGFVSFQISGPGSMARWVKHICICIHMHTASAGTLKRAPSWDAVPAEDSRWIQSPQTVMAPTNSVFIQVCLLFLK